MAWSFSTLAKNARADADTTYAGTGAKLQLWTSGYGTKLAEFSWTGNVFAASSAGAKAMNAPTLATVTGLAVGVAALAKLVKADGSTVVMQDLVVATSGGDVTVSNTNIATGQNCTLNSFTVTEA